MPHPIPPYLEHAAARPHWERVGVRRRLGVCVPLSALRSVRACGVGDTADLFPLIDWCRSIGAGVIQLLPLNDMGSDCVPYAAMSAFALDPVYVALDRIPGLEADGEYLARVRDAASRLNVPVRVDWRAVRGAKDELLCEA